MPISLEKKTEIVKVILEKRNVPANIVMQVKAVVDVSASMRHLFDNGTVQEMVDRLLAVGVRFDDNQSIEAYAFGSGACQLSDIKPEMFGSYVDRHFLPEAKNSGCLWTGTDYASALKLVAKDSGGKKGFFGFGKKEAQPTYLMFVTDGASMNEDAAERLLQEMASQKIYVQFVGIGSPSNFRFIERMGDKYDHVGFVSIRDIENTSDEQLYEALLTEELATWIKNI